MTSYLSSLLWGTSQLDDAIDKATSELLPAGAEDIALNLEICDQIRSKSVPPKDAMRALKRRLNHKNPNVQLLALGLTDICIKNGGDLFLNEVASREFMDNLVSILKIPVLNHDVKSKILRLVQTWAIAFEGRSHLGYVGEVYRTLQREGFNFPPRDPVATTSAMVDTQTAPEWIDSDVCLRCRTAFSFTNRKHHCRNCGQVFDQQCSSKSMTLPHFGITQEVRVCDSCHAKLSKKNRGHRASQSVSSSRHRSARDFADAELQRAIQLSLNEVGAAGGRRPGYVPSPNSWQTSEPPIVDRQTHPYAASYQSDEIEEDDPDLRAAIEASLRESNAPKPSAPLTIDTREEEPSYAYSTAPGYPRSYPPSSATPKPTVPTLPNYDLEPLETDTILTFSQTVEQVQAQGGRDLSRYPAVTELLDKANGLRPKLAMSLGDTSRKEQLLTEMHEKLSQAVKLYDKLLTEQVSHPWRAAQTAQPPMASQPVSGYAAQYQPPPATYNQWAPPSQAQTYFTPPQPSTSSDVQVQSPIAEAYRSPTAAPYQQQPAFTQTYAAPPGPVSIPQYGPPAPAAMAQPPPRPPPTSHPQQPPQPAQSPVSQQSPPKPTIARHNTVTYAASPPAPPINQHTKFLARSNSVSHAPQQLHQLQQTSVPTQLPNFPAVPTSPPAGYQQYGSPEAERKEALLIDL